MIRHLLLIKFKQSADSLEIEKLRLCRNKSMVSLLLSGEKTIAPEGKNQSFTHSVLMTFADEAGRQNYLPHPEHDALKQEFRLLLEDIVVFDYTI
ncbi:Dabb family protein [Vibrio mimicus]|uniref:Dabb family protein n=1 Tax=Vibrio mimicus TaxID=674 RepID=UPI002F95D1D7